MHSAGNDVLSIPSSEADRRPPVVVGDAHAVTPIASLAKAAESVPTTMDADFESFVAAVRRQVEGRLSLWLDARVAEARRRGLDVAVVADGVRQLTLRGGKRLRAVLLAAAYVACGGESGFEPIVPVGVALELFQTYLLVHDDLMDGDTVRRGGPSLPALMRAHFAQKQADAMSILAGDMASAWSQRALLEADLPPHRVLFASRELAKAHDAVVAGQVLDVGGAARDAHAVEAMHALKSASYSVRAPVVIGAQLAGASSVEEAALIAFAEPLGVAFQLRDDILGTFGSAATMGKPVGTDLRAGKRTALVIQALHDASAAARVVRVLGCADASEADVLDAVAGVAACGARDRIEQRIAELAEQSRAALASSPLPLAGRALLSHAVEALTARQS